MNIRIICDNINDLQFNDKKNIELFKFIVNSKINYSKSNNKIFFDVDDIDSTIIYS